MITFGVLHSVFFMASGQGVGAYFMNSNFAGKFVVVLLAICSLAAWFVMVEKYREMKARRIANKLFEKKIGEAPSVLRMDRNLFKEVRCPYSNLAWPAADAYFKGHDIALTTQLRIRYVENALQRAVGEVTVQYESKMVFLGSIVTCAPFLGLLGTVWGVMDAFGGIAVQNSASIQTLAPGVSGALLTTVAGLLVAIPSVVGYNVLLFETKKMITELENFASNLADRIELEAQVEEEQYEEKV